MKEEYFKEIITNITDKCSELKDPFSVSGDTWCTDFSTEFKNDFESYHTKLDKLNEYLYSLSDTTLNVLCALMDFGRKHYHKTLPVNLNSIFNKLYLPYWFEFNKNTPKIETAKYLSSKHCILPEYFDRAKDLLFYSKNKNIEFKCDCGGYLYVSETDGITQYDYHEYELNLECLKCKKPTTKIVAEDFLENSI